MSDSYTTQHQITLIIELLKQLNNKFDVVVQEIENSKSEKSTRLVKGQ
jgi:hypothetical protein